VANAQRRGNARDRANGHSAAAQSRTSIRRSDGGEGHTRGSSRVESSAMSTRKPSPTMRRSVLLAVPALLLISVLGLGIVRSGSDSAIVTVARRGSPVRLLPRGLAFSFLPLERRLQVPREGDEAVLAIPATVHLHGGRPVAARVHLRLIGAGRLPLTAPSVRDRGWDGAWSEWLGTKLGVSESEAAETVRSSAGWRETFPDTPRGTGLDVTARLAPSFRGVGLGSAVLDAEPDAACVRALATDELRSMARDHGRLVVVGLDALDWGLVDELTRRGVMPNLKRLLDRGAQAAVRMHPPLLSPLIWTTLATGQPPAVHGVLDFVEPDPSGGPAQPVTSASRKVPALWEMAAVAGRTSAVIGWWATFPAVGIPGCTIYSDRLSEQLTDPEEERPGLAFPGDALAVARKLAVHTGAATPDLLAPILSVTREELAAVPKGPAGWDDPIGGAVRLMAATVTVQRLTDRELAKGTTVVLAYLEGTDTVGHLFARYRPPAMPGTDPSLARRFGPVADRYHAYIDSWLGRVMAHLGPRDTIVILSDHGFRWQDRPNVSSGAHTATAVYWHRPDALLIAVGPRVRPNPSRQRVDPLDVLPLLLALAGLPPAADVPGHIPAAFVAGPGSSRTAPVRYAAIIPKGTSAAEETLPTGAEEALAKLRALGYIGGTTPSTPEVASRDTARATPGPSAEPTANLPHLEARRLHNLAVGLADRGDLAAAARTFRQAIAADPSYSAPHFALARVLRLIGELDDADGELWTAIDLQVGDAPAALTQVAHEYVLMGHPDRAGAVLAEAGRRYPSDERIWLDLGTLAGQQGDLTLARQCLERAVSLAPTDALALRNLGMACLGLGDRAAAHSAFAEVLRLDPGEAEVRKQLEQLGGPP
jgi:Flp pilus assembly protein TadD